MISKVIYALSLHCSVFTLHCVVQFMYYDFAVRLLPELKPISSGIAVAAAAVASITLVCITAIVVQWSTRSSWLDTQWRWQFEIYCFKWSTFRWHFIEARCFVVLILIIHHARPDSTSPHHTHTHVTNSFESFCCCCCCGCLFIHRTNELFILSALLTCRCSTDASTLFAWNCSISLTHEAISSSNW